MTPEAQRIAIAETQGWQFSQGYCHHVSPNNAERWRKTEKEISLPDYLNDLNACHEMEKALTHIQFLEYADHVFAQNVWPIRATAAQRSEAFLRTLNLWTE